MRDPTNYTNTRALDGGGGAGGDGRHPGPAKQASRLNDDTDAFLHEKFEDLKRSNNGVVSAEDARKFLNESRDRVQDLNSSLNFEQFKETVARELDQPRRRHRRDSSSSTAPADGGNHHNNNNSDVTITLDIGETVRRVLDVFQASATRGSDESGEAAATNLVIGRHDRRLITCFSKPGSNAVVVTGLQAGSTTFRVTNIAGGTAISRRYD